MKMLQKFEKDKLPHASRLTSITFEKSLNFNKTYLFRIFTPFSNISLSKFIHKNMNQCELFFISRAIQEEMKRFTKCYFSQYLQVIESLFYLYTK